MRIRHSESFGLELSGAADELHAVGIALQRSDVDWRDLAIATDRSGTPAPYHAFLESVRFRVGEGPVDVGIDGTDLCISGSAHSLSVLSSYFLGALTSSSHAHFEYYDGAEHVTAQSVPLVIAVSEQYSSILHHPATFSELHLTSILQRELATMPEDRRIALQRLVLPPFERVIVWEYGAAQLILVWVVASCSERNVQIAYSPVGFGASDHWGVIEVHSMSAGRDDSWFLSLDDAFLNSGLWQGPRPDDYEVS